MNNWKYGLHTINSKLCSTSTINIACECANQYQYYTSIRELNKKLDDNGNFILRINRNIYNQSSDLNKTDIDTIIKYMCNLMDELKLKIKVIEV